MVFTGKTYSDNYPQRHLNQLPIEGKVLNGQTVDSREPFSRRKDSNGIDYSLPIKLENFPK